MEVGYRTGRPRIICSMASSDLSDRTSGGSKGEGGRGGRGGTPPPLPPSNVSDLKCLPPPNEADDTLYELGILRKTTIW